MDREFGHLGILKEDLKECNMENSRETSVVEVDEVAVSKEKDVRDPGQYLPLKGQEVGGGGRNRASVPN